MIKTIITPQNTDISLTIPANYIGKQIEILLYGTDEIDQPKIFDLKIVGPTDL